jgi:Flp pilus assembly pilin Flp
MTSTLPEETMNLLKTLLGGRSAWLLQGRLPLSLEREEGQTLVEYALILAFIAIIVIVALVFLQGKISSIFSSIGNSL